MTRTAAFDLAAEVAGAHASTTVAAADHLSVSFSSGGLAFTANRRRWTECLVPYPDDCGEFLGCLEDVSDALVVAAATATRPRVGCDDHAL